MSQEPELPEAEALAAEHALGVLTGDERQAAEARMARDPAFAALVESWRGRLEPLLDEVAPAAPSPALWNRIEQTLPANDDVSHRLRFWRTMAVGSLGLAAASLATVVLLATRPPVAPPAAPPPPILNASLTAPSGVQPLFVAAYDPQRKALIVTSLVPPGADPAHVHQLWLIPADGRPRSLGLVEPGRSKSMPMAGGVVTLMSEGAALAVSVEPRGGSPRPDAPSGPIAAAGKLAKI